MFTVMDVADRMNGWNYLRVVKVYENEVGNMVAETVHTDEKGYEPVPDDVMDLEVTTISVEGNTIVLECEE